MKKKKHKVVQAVKIEGGHENEWRRGEGKETRQLPLCPAIHFRISASEMYRGIKTFIVLTNDGCQDIKSHLISDAKNPIHVRDSVSRTDKPSAFRVKEGKSVGQSRETPRESQIQIWKEEFFKKSDRKRVRGKQRKGGKGVMRLGCWSCACWFPAFELPFSPFLLSLYLTALHFKTHLWMSDHSTAVHDFLARVISPHHRVLMT